MNEMITMNRECPICGKTHSMTMNKNEYIKGCEAYNNGALIQDAFPNFTPSQREFLMTGICDSCWDKM